LCRDGLIASVMNIAYLIGSIIDIYQTNKYVIHGGYHEDVVFTRFMITYYGVYGMIIVKLAFMLILNTAYIGIRYFEEKWSGTCMRVVFAIVMSVLSFIPAIHNYMVVSYD